MPCHSCQEPEHVQGVIRMVLDEWERQGHDTRSQRAWREMLAVVRQLAPTYGPRDFRSLRKHVTDCLGRLNG